MIEHGVENEDHRNDLFDTIIKESNEQQKIFEL
jgi:hypothetical protein